MKTNRCVLNLTWTQNVCVWNWFENQTLWFELALNTKRVCLNFDWKLTGLVWTWLDNSMFVLEIRLKTRRDVLILTYLDLNTKLFVLQNIQKLDGMSANCHKTTKWFVITLAWKPHGLFGNRNENRMLCYQIELKTWSYVWKFTWTPNGLL